MKRNFNSSILGFIVVLILTGCSVDLDGKKEEQFQNLTKEIEDLKTSISANKVQGITPLNQSAEIPTVSFRVHIIQFWWLHSKIHDGVYWKVSSLTEPTPAMDSAIQDLPEGLLDITYLWRKDWFKITCPKTFSIIDCSINGKATDSWDNSCVFYFPDTWENSDINLTCSNNLLEAPL